MSLSSALEVMTSTTSPLLKSSGTLSELYKHLEFRGVEVCQCSLYLHETERQAWPEADQTCQQVNETLKESSCCIDLDGFLQSLSPQHWRAAAFQLQQLERL